jgi:hypothetical protein
MTCRDFEQMWNELLDGARAGASVPGRVRQAATDWAGDAQMASALREHAASCAACRVAGERYQLLLRALSAWSSPPVVPGDLGERVLAAAGYSPIRKPTAPRRTRGEGRLWRIAVAAMAAAAMFFIIVGSTSDRLKRITWLWKSPAPQSSGLAGPRVAAPVDVVGLHQAVLEATDATLDLARSASEPAARISLQVLDAAAQPKSGGQGARALSPAASEPGELAVPSLTSFGADPAAASAMLQEIGDRLASGVRPLSASARTAFGFLLGPPAAKPVVRENLPGAKGA